MQLLIPRIANAFRILAVIVLAQLACPLAVADIQDDFLMDEILVTATKRLASIQDVPVSIDALGGEILDSRGAIDLRSLGQLSPSVSIFASQSVANTTSVRIRGVGTTGNNAGFESSVGIFIDGVYQPRPGIAMGEFVDIEQVEILRGPQGTLFGRNTSVGAISVKSKRPDIFDHGGFFNTTVGNYGLVNVQAGYNLPLADTVAFRIAGSWRNREGTMNNADSSLPDSNDMDRYLVRLQGLWEPTETFSLRVIADTSESDENCCDPVLVTLNSSGQSQPPGTSAGIATSQLIDDRITFSTGRSESSDQSGVSAEMVWQINDALELTYIPAYRESESRSTGDDDFTAADVIRTDASMPNTADVESMTHELRAHFQAFDGYLDSIIGLYYSDEKIGEVSARVGGDDLPFPSPNPNAANAFEQD
ncbi:MAG: TonB-dependent receptor plug domain-containing protein, partial [Pseudomonadales bacterium]